MKQLRIAVVGATGNVGRELVRLLEDFPLLEGDPVFLASNKSVDEEIDFMGEICSVQPTENFDFSETDLVFFATDSITTRQYIGKAKAAGCYVIDCSSTSRIEADTHLVVPELNGHLVQKDHKNYASPDAAAIQLSMVLAVLEKKAAISRVSVTVMQSVSYAGRDAMDELYAQSAALIGGSGAEAAEPFHFPTQIAFNVVPQVGGFQPNGLTTTEQEIIIETNKLLNGTVPMDVTCAYVPTFVGVAASVNVQFAASISAEEARTLLEKAPGITVIDNPKQQEYSTPFGAAEIDDVFVSRIREDRSTPNSLTFWVVADNLRKGSAGNMVQIAAMVAEIA